MQSTTARSDNLLVGIGFATFIVLGLNAGLMGVAWPSIRNTFGVGDSAFGVISVIAMLGSLIVTFYNGWLVERFGIGVLLLVSCTIGALGYLGYALAPVWWVVISARLLASIGIAAVNPGINTYFATRESAGRMNWLHACFGLGATLGPIVMTAVLRAGHTWRWGYGINVLLYGLLAATFWWTLRRWPLARRTAHQEARPSTAAPRARTWALPAVWLSALLFFAFTGLEVSAGQWPYTLFTEARDVAAATAGTWVSVYWMSMTVGRAVFGVVVDRVSLASLVRLCMGGAIVGTIVIWKSGTPYLGFVGLALTGFCLAPLFPVLTSTTRERLGEQHTVDAIGYQLTAVKLGLAVIPALGGVLTEHWGAETIGPFLFVTSIAVFLLHEATLRTGTQS